MHAILEEFLSKEVDGCKSDGGVEKGRLDSDVLEKQMRFSDFVSIGVWWHLAWVGLRWGCGG